MSFVCHLVSGLFYFSCFLLQVQKFCLVFVEFSFPFNLARNENFILCKHKNVKRKAQKLIMAKTQLSQWARDGRGEGGGICE